jgi:hydroxymethylpyrimidine kinase/phosphomethylpyrimidine kinase
MTHPFRDGSRPDVLVCSGLDPSGGAGFIADVRIISELGGRPVGVVTALTVQNTTGVVASEALGPELIREQLELLLSDVEVKAVKIGMIGSSEIAQTIAEALALTRAPVVWDPVIHPSRGDVPFVDSRFGHAITALVPHVAVLTPNAAELAFLAGKPIATLADAAVAGQALATQLGTAVLVKGGHLDGRERTSESIDILCRASGVQLLRGPRVRDGEHVHGTGCALSSALAVHLAHGTDLLEACRAAKDFVAARLAQPAHPGRGARAVV